MNSASHSPPADPPADHGHKSTDNAVLQRFSAETLHRWAPHLHEVVLKEGTVLHKQGVPIAHAYFPSTAVLALEVGALEQPSAALMLIGRRGMLGIGALFGVNNIGLHAVALLPGKAWRLEAGQLRAEFERGDAAGPVLMDSIQALIASIVQTSLCIRQHSVEEQLATRLLQLMHLVDSSWLPLTQARLADLLGTRRENVNQTLRQWKASGAVELQRGGLRILHPAALRNCCCKCHAAILKTEVRSVGRAH